MASVTMDSVRVDTAGLDASVTDVSTVAYMYTLTSVNSESLSIYIIITSRDLLGSREIY